MTAADTQVDYSVIKDADAHIRFSFLLFEFSGRTRTVERIEVEAA